MQRAEWVSKTCSVPNSALRYCLDKAQYLGLEFSLHPLLFPNKKAYTSESVIVFIQLVVVKFVKDLILLLQFEVLE